MQTFTYERPATLEEAISLLERHGDAARVLAGGTDLIIRLRDRSLRPDVVVDVKRIPELRPGIERGSGRLTITAGTVMSDLVDDEEICRSFPALAEAASVVGSIQIRNRATLVGNVCNASPAADTAPALLVYGATVVAAGPGGTRRIPIDSFFVRSGRTTLARGELVTAIELPIPEVQTGSVHLRRTRRRGHDLASVTLCCAVDESRRTRMAYGSLGPRPVLVTDDSGRLASDATPAGTKAAILDELLAGAAPSPTSMRASPEYRLAMLRVLATRAIAIATARLAGGSAA